MPWLDFFNVGLSSTAALAVVDERLLEYMLIYVVDLPEFPDQAGL